MENISADALQIAPRVDWQDMGEREHFVQFYESDAFLVESVAGYVRAGLVNGESSVVLMTPEHRAALQEALAKQGLDVEAAKSSGRLRILDAAEELSRFMVNGSPDEAAFAENMGGLMKEISGPGKRVRAFGEMVSILWAEGNPEAAIRVEQLWNKLSDRHIFSLFCAYPMSRFGDSAHSNPLLHICHEHTRVIPCESYSARSRENDRLREIALLQQQANALRAEITERKRVEQELRDKKEQLSSLMENATIGMHWVGPDGVILWANRAELELLGYSSEEYLGRHIADFHADRNVIETMLNCLSSGERLRNFEARMKCRDGSIKHVLVDSSVVWEDGKFLHTQCFTRDVTEKKEADFISHRLAAIVESSGDAIASKDLSGVIKTWNRGAERLFGYTAEEAVGKSVTILIPENALDEEPKILERIRRGERIEHYETLRRHKDGHLIDISLSVSPIRNSRGDIVGASKIARDITQRKTAERAVREAQQKLARANEDLERRVAERTQSLQEAMHQMEEFSYSLSHDLRGPLRAMQGYCHILLEDAAADLSPENLSYLKRIGQSAERLDRLVQDVLAYTRVSRVSMEMSRVQTEHLILEVLRNYTNEQHPAPTIVIDRPLLDVLGHEASLVQCLSNLIGNALKFVRPGTQPHIHIWTQRIHNSVRLWIEDNGIGISKDQQTKIFDMFERAPEVRAFPGTGVGLAIVKKAVGRMRGEAGVDSTPGVGSRFWIQLPAAEA